MRRSAVLFAVIALTGGIAGGAKADGTIIMNRASDFQSKTAEGTITGLIVGDTSPQQNATNMALRTAYPDNTAVNQPANLTKVNAAASATSVFSGLLTSSTAAPNQQYASAWTFGYHIDPDLTDYTINLHLYLPQVGTFTPSGGVGTATSGINAVTIFLTSVSNGAVSGSRAWTFDNNLSPGILQTGLEEFSLAAVNGAGAGGSNDFHQDAGFDLHQVFYVSIGYRGYLDNSFPVAPDGTHSFWTGTQSLNVTAVTPEPNSALILACCLVGTGVVRSRLRARSRRLK
jgi:hypothetical protein